MTADTPPGRLLALFDRVRTIDEQLSAQDLWGKALGFEPQSIEEAVLMSELCTLLRDTGRELRSIVAAGAGDEGALLYGFPSWSDAVYGRDDGGDFLRGTGVDLIPDHARHSLAAAHGQIVNIVREGCLDDAVRAGLFVELKSTIDELVEQVRETSFLREDLRVVLIRRLQEVLDTVAYAEFRGDREVLGVAHIAQQVFTEAANHVPGEAGKKIKEWSTVLTELTNNIVRSFSAPAGAVYFASTKDLSGAIAIAALGSPEYARMLKNSKSATPGQDQ